jgi:hypothetical protein
MGALVVTLILPPVMMDRGYYFLPDIQTDMTIEWVKNPIRPIRHFATGITSDIHYITEVDHHIELAGEVPCFWEDNRIFPFGYFHDPIADHWKVVFLPANNKKATARVLYVADTPGRAKMILTLLYARIKGIQMMIEEDVTEQPMIHSISYTTDEILTIKNISFQCQCDITLAKLIRVGEGFELSYYDMKLLKPGEIWEKVMEPGDYYWQIECFDMLKNNEPLPVQNGGLRFPSPGIDDQIEINCFSQGKTL